MLNTIGKLIESLTARRIQDLAEKHNLLLEAQMGGRKNKSTKTALDLLTSQVRMIWGLGRHVASLLSLDISGAFDIVNYIRLLYVLREKGLPPWLVQ